MSRKQQKNMKGGGLFDFLGITKGTVSTDEKAKRLKELESMPSKDLAKKVIDLESEIQQYKKDIEELKNPKVAPAPANTGVAPVDPMAAAVGAVGAVGAVSDMAKQFKTPVEGGNDGKDSNPSTVPMPMPMPVSGPPLASPVAGGRRKTSRKTRKTRRHKK